MFYFKITTRSKRGDTRSSRNSFHQFTRASHVGEYIAAKLEKSGVTSISVTRISQGAYLRARG